MRIRLKIHWRNYVPGDVTKDLPDGVAKTMIQRGIAEAVVKAMDHPPRDKTMKREQVKRK